MRIEESERNQPNQVDRDEDQSPAAFHFQPQNRNTAMMCAVANTAKASVIG
jgi:hypothetical protein